MHNLGRKLCSFSKGPLVFCVIIVLFFPFGADSKKTINDHQSALSTVAERTGIEQVSVQEKAGQIVKAALSLVGIVFFILVFYAGLRWMTARGEQDVIAKARNTIIYAVIGLAITVAAFAITNFLTQRLIEGKATGSGAIGGPSDSFGNQPMGCCMDKVGEGPLSSWGNAGIWACRIDVEETCRTVGNAVSSGDDIVGDDYWKWFEGEKWPACEARCDEINIF